MKQLIMNKSAQSIPLPSNIVIVECQEKLLINLVEEK